ncbi:MAG: cation:proton antiporter [Clostridia bacterium]|jgi:Kef-type K+ transport system membrane component KefB/mannitol/fructose-specific phosphotransferase system IIA component (Ntr-type)
MKRVRLLLLAGFMVLVPSLAFASGASHAETQTALVIQVGIVLFAVKLGGILAQKLNVPTVLGELAAGILIGPFALGGIAIPGFPHGLFGSLAPGLDIPVSPELYGIATIASIILLFVSGLETDLRLFIKYSLAGGLVGIGGVILAFAGGDFFGVLVLGGSFMDPRNLFFGIMSTATSVGITARILSDRKKMDSPEGVTILAAAVFDDVLGIVVLAVVLGIASATSMGGTAGIAWSRVGIIAARAFGIWLGATVIGLVLSKRIAGFLKSFKHASAFSILALGLALVVSGFFEKEGLAMIIGAYVMGLSLSKTDISHIIIEKIHILYEFFVPIFFAVMGMLVDVRQFASPVVLLGGLAYTVLGIATKLIGCGVPALFAGFNARGALRIGAGMIPRGEVALIIAGIGVSGGILDPGSFGMAIMMTLLTTLIAPFGLTAALRLPGPGTLKPTPGGDSRTVDFDFPSDDVAILVTDTMTHQLQSEGFFVRTMDIENGIALVRKDEISFSMRLEGIRLTAQATDENLPILQAAVFDAVATLNQSFGKLKDDFDPSSIRHEVSHETAPLDKAEAKAIDRSCIIMELESDTKEGVIHELLDALQKAGRLEDRNLVENDVMDRERSMSTGMQYGIALPHAKTDGVRSLSAAVGIKRGGMDFKALDGQPTRIIVLSVSPKKNPTYHLQFMAGIGRALGDDARRVDVLAAGSPEELLRLLGV